MGTGLLGNRVDVRAPAEPESSFLPVLVDLSVVNSTSASGERNDLIVKICLTHIYLGYYYFRLNVVSI